MCVSSSGLDGAIHHSLCKGLSAPAVSIPARSDTNKDADPLLGGSSVESFLIIAFDS